MPTNHYERSLRIRTTGWRSDLKKKGNQHRYEPTPYEALDALFYHYDLEADDVIVDIGSGKGRVPFYIHSRFQTVVKGIEMSEVLHEKALKNKRTFRQRIRRGEGNIRLKQKFAESYEIKPEDSHFYLFNPFTVDVFQRVVANILRSMEQHPRPVDLILYYPTESYRRFLAESTPFVPVQDIHVPGAYEKDDHARFLIYRYDNR